MKRVFAVIFAAILLTSVVGPNFALAGDATPVVYKQDFTFKIVLLPNGSANITMTSIWLGPKEEIDKQIEKILNETQNGNMTMEEAIEKFEQEQLARYIQGLTRAGVKLVNESMKSYGIEEGNNITLVFNAIALDYARYYSYDHYWELWIDPTRGYGSMMVPDTGFPFGVEANNTFIVVLPPNATLLSYPKPFVKQYNQSRFAVESSAEGDTVIVRSRIYLEPWLTPDGFKSLFGDYGDYYIRYKTPYEGVEHYEKSVTNEYVTIDVYSNGTVRLHMKDEYVEPLRDVIARKAEIVSYGVQNVTEYILRTYSLALGYQGAIVDGGKVTILGLNETTAPLVIDAEYMLRNFTKYENGSYVYTFDPTMGMAQSLQDRSEYEVNNTLHLTLNLTDGGEFIEVPDNISTEVKGNRFTMTVVRRGNTLEIVSNVYIRYGAQPEDVKELLANRTSATVRYTLAAEESNGGMSDTGKMAAVIVAALIVVLAVAFWKRR
ncbi:exodeoxyribonuclease VII small subunit [Thermococcus indicus]|uniref:Exodeoxyribonuclease VII small subunit n=1 Tax=Thermococcus indicus TaxID=2586643 RepID=A0A4Y5SK99_9EURY|nr:exodeoxyribonuclease VII small subunit [Thermococcus indicus]QDA31328.1 exodeoxyribonuclease VII small subunit [Thermococcus indicus]